MTQFNWKKKQELSLAAQSGKRFGETGSLPPNLVSYMGKATN